VTSQWKDKSFEAFGRWTPDGRYYIFLAGQDRLDIWALRERRRFLSFRAPQLIRLTSGPILYSSLAFSSDGKKIFTRGIEVRGEVERYDPKASQFSRLRPTLSADCCVYSHDGQLMAYVTFPEGNLWRSRPDGSQRQQLTWPPLAALNPHWSPDDKQIAFTAFLPSKVPKTLSIPAEGGEPHQIAQNDCDELEANWSPDGTRITFGSFAGSPSSCPMVLHIVDMTTHLRSRVTRFFNPPFPMFFLMVFCQAFSGLRAIIRRSA
jgi:eukaryotic-like serine/threonine-protein kinase